MNSYILYAIFVQNSNNVHFLPIIPMPDNQTYGV